MAISDLMPWNAGRREMTRQAPDPVRALQFDINQVFDDFFRGFAMPNLDLTNQSGTGRAIPPLDVRDTGREIEVKAELPGMNEGDVEVTVSNGALVIRGEKRDERERQDRDFVMRERSFGLFERVVPLPEGVDADVAQASFKDGVLTVTIPKTALAQDSAKRIDVREG